MTTFNLEVLPFSDQNSNILHLVYITCIVRISIIKYMYNKCLKNMMQALI